MSNASEPYVKQVAKLTAVAAATDTSTIVPAVADMTDDDARATLIVAIGVLANHMKQRLAAKVEAKENGRSISGGF